MVEINNLTIFKFGKKRLGRLAEGVLEKEKRGKTDLSVTFVGPKEIQRLNKKYRKINRPTDTISFTYKNFGEIVICPQIVVKNAERFGETFKRELARVLIHGILHILGYNHKKGGKKDDKMIKKQEYYLFKLLTTNH